MIKYEVKVYDNGSQHWYLNGVLHREDGPAVISIDGVRWYKNGKLHRDGDAPAVIDSAAGVSYWYKNGKIHRDGDRPAVVYERGIQYWYQNGKIHRDGDKPALVSQPEGAKFWYMNGVMHRSTGPAVVRTSGNDEYYLDGIPFSKRRFLEMTAPTKELSIAEIEKLLGYRIKVVK